MPRLTAESTPFLVTLDEKAGISGTGPTRLKEEMEVAARRALVPGLAIGAFWSVAI
jgi:hypothetical protein